MERTVYLVPHTHWDREWYQTFEQFRVWLVEMMDGLIDLLDRDEGFGHFHLDGQTALIHDYLAVKPEREDDIRRLARAGRVSIGPWFTQMDEFLVSGESLIRNLEWGLADATDFAGATAAEAIGYLPDQFGHIGQMPQILANAGVPRAVVWRGVPSAIDRTTFRWEAPDGSAVLTEYLAFGYSVGWRLTQCEDAEQLANELRQAAEHLAPYSARDRLLVTVGGDHHVPASKLAPLLAQVNGADGAGTADGPIAEIRSLRDFVDEPDPAGVPIWRGELRSAARAHLLPNVYSARSYQKAKRARVENLLERFVEPLAALVPGFEWPGSALRAAWRNLLWNGAHDSVCGCSIDDVARAVDERYDEAEALGRALMDRLLQGLAARMSSPGTMHFNPSPFRRLGVPGLGWKVGADVPITQAVPLSIEDGVIVTGPFRLRLVDEGDIGDLYTFCPTGEAPPAEPSSLSIRDDAIAAGTGEPYRGQVLKAVFDDGLHVELWGVREHEEGEEEAVRLLLKIVNGRPDHRVRLHVALDRSPEGSAAMTPFQVVRRPLQSEGGTETPSPTWPARGAVLAGDVAGVQEGVFEYEVRDDPAELMITLLRCVGTISRPKIETRNWAAGPDIATPDAQMIGEHHAAITLARGIGPEDLPSAWERWYLPMAAVDAPGGGDRPGWGSLLEIEGAELSSVRRVSGGVEVRIWNPTLQERPARVGDRTFTIGPARIETVRLGSPVLGSGV